MAEAEL